MDMEHPELHNFTKAAPELAEKIRLGDARAFVRSSSLDAGYANFACYVEFLYDGVSRYATPRHDGFSVRPVYAE